MKKKLVIAQVLPAMQNGGVERGCVEIANYLAKCGHHSMVISAGGKMLEQLASEVEHVELAVGKKSLTAWFLLKKLKNLFIDKKIDIIHARSRLPAWLAYLAIKRIKTNKPQFITTIHGLYSVKKYSAIMARGDRVIAVSKTALNYVKNNYTKDLKVEPRLIYRGINPDEFPAKHEADLMWMQKFYRQHHQLVGHKMVLMAGRLSALKGAKDLLTWLQSTDNDAKLVFTADPEHNLYAAKLFHFFKQHQVQHRIVWIGLQTCMADLYAIADVVVSASKKPESFGRTVLEALAVGTPVVAYNHGGVAEILAELYPQGAVSFGNTQQLSDKINRALNSEQQPMFKVPDKFLLKNMLQQTEQLYRECCHAE